MTRRAVIVGGGVGGLTAALAFLRIGWEVVVLERASALREVGAGLQISPNAMRPLKALGLGAALLAAGRAPETLEMRLGVSGRRVFRIEQRRAMHRRHGAPYLAFHRADLLSCLAEALTARAPGALRLGAEVVGREGAAAVLADGSRLEADLLIGADGLRSALRAAMLGEERPTFTGAVAWRCLAPRSAAPGLPDGVCVWAGEGRHVVTYPLRDGAMINLVGVVDEAEPVEEGWSGDAAKEEMLARFRGWDERLRALIDAAPAHLRWGLFTRPPLPWWSDGALTLLGDACHPMLPSLAQGAAQAIEDAWTLAALVDRHPLDEAMAAYEAERKPRVTRIQAQAARNVGTFHKSGLSRLIAYTPMAAAGLIWPGAIRMQNDWVYRWRGEGLDG